MSLIKHKLCDGCQKQLPIFKNMTIEGKRLRLCKSCATKRERSKTKQKKEKEKQVRREKRERITEKKLDSLVSKVIRTLYGDKCCTCSSILEFGKLHCGHFVSRQFRSVRFNPQNLASQCPNCNLYLQGSQYEFGKFINSFHGEGIADKIIALSKSGKKIGQIERNQIHEVYKAALEHLDLKKLIDEYYKVFP